MHSSFDLSYLQSLSEDPAFIPKILHIFLNQVPLQVATLKQTLEENNPEQTGLILHQIKPSMQTVGCKGLIPEIIELEQLARNGFSPLDRIDRYHKLIQEIEVVISAIKDAAVRDFNMTRHKF